MDLTIAKSYRTVNCYFKKILILRIDPNLLNNFYCFENTVGCVDFEVDLSGSKWCVLSAEMSRGRGDNAWQHAQIARQSTKELNQFPLSLRIFFGSFD